MKVYEHEGISYRSLAVVKMLANEPTATQDCENWANPELAWVFYFRNDILQCVRPRLTNGPGGLFSFSAIRKELPVFWEVSEEQVAQFDRDGYLIVAQLFDNDEMDLLLRTAKEDQALAGHAVGLNDNKGGVSRLTAWFVAGDDLYGYFARCHRVAANMEKLLRCEIYHYHSKMMLKEPRTGGAWTWHQDYGYWYNAGYIYPDMASCLIAVDRATKENGCLQILKGSHKMGRIDHVLTGEQTGADMDRVEQAMKQFELVYCEAEPGTAVFFHGNTLHASAQNKSANPRWSLICCFTGIHNTPYNEPQHPGYESLVKVDDTAIRECGARTIGAGAVFHGKASDTYSKRKS